MKTAAVKLALCTLLFANAALATENFPKDVQAFIEKRDGCEHFRGEAPDPPDKKRMAEINREIKKLCTGTDARLAALKRKYAGTPEIKAHLDAYDSSIEVHSKHRKGRHERQ